MTASTPRLARIVPARSEGCNQRSARSVSPAGEDVAGRDGFGPATLCHLDMVYNLARKLCSSPHEADDVVQETYARALQAWERHRPEQVRPWLATICLNVVRSEYRRRRARPREVLDPSAGVTVGAPVDTAQRAISQLTRVAVHEALGRLPLAQREAITLMDLCRFTAAEVAEITGVPRGTVLARVHRGHKRLAALLSAEVSRES